MRLSSLQVYQQSLNGINKTSTEIAQTQNQLTTGQRVNIGSDDPVATEKIIDMETELSTNIRNLIIIVSVDLSL